MAIIDGQHPDIAGELLSRFNNVCDAATSTFPG